MSKSQKQKKSAVAADISKKNRLNKKFYFKELEHLQLELVKLHEWVKAKNLMLPEREV